MYSSAIETRQPPCTARLLGRLRPRALAVGVLLLLTTMTQGARAASAVTVERVVKGAQVARFTLTRPNELLWGIKTDRTTPLAGFTLARVGSDPFAVDLLPASLGPEARMGVNFVPHGGSGLVMPVGTYDLMLFSQSTARVRMAFAHALPALHFASRALQSWSAADSASHPSWEHLFQMSLASVPHGVFVYMHDEWTGDGRSSQTVCQTATCPPVNDQALQRLAEGNDGVPGSHAMTSSDAISGSAFAKGSNSLTVQSMVAGAAAKRGAAVLVVP
jgi:hypothetical protein